MTTIFDQPTGYRAPHMIGGDMPLAAPVAPRRITPTVSIYPRPLTAALKPGQHQGIPTLATAMAGAKKLTPENVESVIKPLTAVATQVKAGAGTAVDYGVLAGHLDLARCIERQGIVRGFCGHLDEIEAAMKGIRSRADKGDTWEPQELTFAEADAINDLLELHQFQLEQLSTSEFTAAAKLALAVNATKGDKVQMVRATSVAAAREKTE